jgi:hypothetical protein
MFNTTQTLYSEAFPGQELTVYNVATQIVTEEDTTTGAALSVATRNMARWVPIAVMVVMNMF